LVSLLSGHAEHFFIMPRKAHKPVKLEFFIPDKSTSLELPLYINSIPAGFPSPAEDYMDKKLDLNDFLIRNPSSTFFVKVTGTSMVNAGINDGDILIVDRSVEPRDNRIVIGVVNGEFTVKRIRKKNSRLFLLPENEAFNPVEVTEEMDFRIWGVVIYAIHKL
jgi:DNA polymerase V